MSQNKRYKKVFDPKRNQWHGEFNGTRVTGFYDPGEIRELEQELENFEKEYEVRDDKVGVRPFKDYFETVVRTGQPQDQVEFAKSYLEYKKKQPLSRQ
jgi:predicted HicB family RNase H-like nuclease